MAEGNCRKCCKVTVARFPKRTGSNLSAGHSKVRPGPPPDIINNIQKENNTFKEGARWGLKAKLSNVVPETLKHSIIFHFNFHLFIHCVAAHLQNQWSAEGSKCHTSAHMTRKIKNTFSKGIFYCHVWLPEGIQFRIPFLGVQQIFPVSWQGNQHDAYNLLSVNPPHASYLVG